MAYDEKNKTEVKAHSVKLDDRSRLTVSGVEDVESFDENEIVMNTSHGNLIVKGSGLHIEKITLDVGELSVAGMIDELCYEAKPSSRSFWSGLFS